MTTTRDRFYRWTASLVCAVGTLVQAGTRAEQRQPPFRAGVQLVRVDAYPSRDGKIIEGLSAADFEVLEDGVLQKVESFEFVRFPQSNPVEERRDPNSQREGFQLASDPSYRVFVIYLDNLHVDFAGSHNMRVPLIAFLNQVLGPKDLFGVLTTRQSVSDLMLGQKTASIEEQLTRYWDWGRGARVLEDDEDRILALCFDPRTAGELTPRRRMDEVFTDLESLIATLGGIREERKNVLLVSNGWTLPGPAPWVQETSKPRLPGVGVTNAGKITTGATHPGTVDPKLCESMRQRLASMDFQYRLRDLLRLAREANVTFYTIKPTGLVAYGDDRAQVDALLALSTNTDGLAVVNTNDLTSGARRIAADLSAAYLLGYYPTNTATDGRIRRITVRLKPSGASVRARREYRALTAADVAAMRTAAAGASASPATPAAEAFAELTRVRPGAVLHTRGTVVGEDMVIVSELSASEVEAGRWKSGGDLQVMVSAKNGDVIATTRGRLEPGQRATVIRIPLKGHAGPFDAAVRLRSAADGETQDGATVTRPAAGLGSPLVYRVIGAGAPRPAGSVLFRRTERIQAHWPVAGSVDAHEARVLGRDGVALDLRPAVSVREEAGVTLVVAELNLAPLTAGEYVIEIAAKGAQAPSGQLAFRVSR